MCRQESARFEEGENENKVLPSAFPSAKSLSINKPVETNENEVAIRLDIGNFVGISVDDLTLMKLLQNPWVPPPGYKFPYSTHNKKGKEEKRYAGQQHLNQFQWLVFSKAKRGFYCKFCPFFVNGTIGGHNNTILLKKLVTEPLTSFAKLLGNDGALIKHAKNDYHKEASIAAERFLTIQKNPSLEIVNQIDNNRLEQIQENRRRLKPIVESIVFLGRQNIAFRGHRDDGPFNVDNINDSPVNEGNFRELIRYRIKGGDNQLLAHLEKSSSRSTYISKTTQNELITCCGEEVLDVIVKRIQASPFFSVIFDETTDKAHISQMTLVLRYSHTGTVREDFVGFVNVNKEISALHKNEPPNLETKLSGVNLGKVAIKALKQLKFDLKYCVSISSDGCTVMISEACGAVAEIQKEALNAVYSSCLNHKLNLSISKSSFVQLIRNAVGTMKVAISFFTASSKRSLALKNVLGFQLTGLCETRWVERHDGVLQFRLSLPKIIETLDFISLWEDVETAAKARALKLSLSDGQFILAVVSLSSVLSCTLSLSQLIQNTQIDLKTAQEAVRDTLTLLQRKRLNSEETFSSIFIEASDIAHEIGSEIKIPRVTNRQMNRPNYSTNNCEVYYRQSLYIPLLDNVIQDCNFRFSEENLSLYNFSILFPDSKRWNDDVLCKAAITALAKKYYIYFNDCAEALEVKLSAEFEMWKIKWQREYYDNTFTALKLLAVCDSKVYPHLNVLFKIFVAIPCSVASGERSFSSLRRIKYWLRTTTSDERLTGLALMNINYDIVPDIDCIIDRYAVTHKHRLEFLL